MAFALHAHLKRNKESELAKSRLAMLLERVNVSFFVKKVNKFLKIKLWWYKGCVVGFESVYGEFKCHIVTKENKKCGSEPKKEKK